MIRHTLLCLALALPSPAPAETLANKLFGAKEYPSAQLPMPVGSYAKGCGAGMMELPDPAQPGRRCACHGTATLPSPQWCSS